MAGDGFSVRVENHVLAIGAHFMHFNFARPNQTLTKRYGKPTTPATAAEKGDHVGVGGMAGLLD